MSEREIERDITELGNKRKRGRDKEIDLVKILKLKEGYRSI